MESNNEISIHSLICVLIMLDKPIHAKFRLGAFVNHKLRYNYIRIARGLTDTRLLCTVLYSYNSMSSDNPQIQ